MMSGAEPDGGPGIDYGVFSGLRSPVVEGCEPANAAEVVEGACEEVREGAGEGVVAFFF